jgi:hypothetical protein
MSRLFAALAVVAALVAMPSTADAKPSPTPPTKPLIQCIKAPCNPSPFETKPTKPPSPFPGPPQVECFRAPCPY